MANDYPFSKGLYRLLRKSFFTKYNREPTVKEVKIFFRDDVIVGNNVIYDKATGERLDFKK